MNQIVSTSPIVNIIKCIVLLSVTLLYPTEKVLKAQQLNVTGNGQEISNGSEDFSESNYTDFGIKAAGGDPIDKEFTVKNTGSSDLTITSIELEDDQTSYFEIEEDLDTTIPANGSDTFTIRFDPDDLGIGLAKVVIESNAPENDSYSFYITGNNSDCIQCFGIDQTNSNVCSGKGDCVAQDTCECDGLYAGKECGTLMEWQDSESSKTTWSQDPGGPTIKFGPELEDNNKYTWTWEIKKTDPWPGSFGWSFGVSQYPPVKDTQHDLGFEPREWAYEGKTGDIYHDEEGKPWGRKVENIGDQIRIELDTEKNTIKFYTKQGGESEFTLEGEEDGVAFSDIEKQEGTKWVPAVSVQAIYPSTLEFVDE